MQRRNKLSATLLCKCPRCHKGDLFTHSLIKLNRFTVTNTNCPHCELKFEKEPGFFFGAMYISYAFIVATLITTIVILYNFFGDPEPIVYASTVPIIIFLLLPLIFRLSRSIYLHLASGVKYDSDFDEKQ
jgi:uncharacterized protein (DUF983 family)